MSTDVDSTKINPREEVLFHFYYLCSGNTCDLLELIELNGPCHPTTITMSYFYRNYMSHYYVSRHVSLLFTRDVGY